MFEGVECSWCLHRRRYERLLEAAIEDVEEIHARGAILTFGVK